MIERRCSFIRFFEDPLFHSLSLVDVMHSNLSNLHAHREVEYAFV